MTNRRYDSLDFLMYGIMLLCAVMLVIIPLACVSSIKENQRRELEMQADNCKLTLESKTGKRIYCGKDCWREEIRKEFTCNSGTKVIVE